MDEFGDPKYVDVWADDVVTLSLQYSTQWDSLAHVGAEFDADGDGVEEAVYYNGYRAGVDLVGPQPDAAGDGGRPPLLRPPPGSGAHGRHRRAGPGRPRRPGPPPGPRLARGRPADPRRRSWRPTTWSSSRATCSCCTPGSPPRSSQWNRDPDPVKIHTHVLVPRRPRRVVAGVDQPTRRSRRWWPTTTRSKGCSARTATRAATRSCPSTTCACSGSASPSGEMWYLHELAAWLREHDRSRFLLTAPPLRLPGVVGSPLTPVATV